MSAVFISNSARVPHTSNRLMILTRLLNLNVKLSSCYKSPIHSISNRTSRCFSSKIDIDDQEYHRIANKYMDTLCEALEEFGDDLTGQAAQSFDVSMAAGVLTLKLSKASSSSNATYVINKQPPNKQIWLSSPISGPRRYNWSLQIDQWIDTRVADVTKMTRQDILENRLAQELKTFSSNDLLAYMKRS